MGAKVLEFPADRIAKGIHAYYPELNEHKVNCQLTASLSHNGNHYFVDSPEELPVGRSIKFIKRYTVDSFTNREKNPKVGWYSYKVTENAFEKLKLQYSISSERHLD
ncbi:MAG: hypothetical protein K6T85_19300 [Gorillibacterium sp.]|nr:hypothetical protein [Gorillibacterium sp.]